MNRPPDNAQVEAVFEILQNHCPAAAGNRLVARRIVAAVEHAATQDEPTGVVLLVSLPSTQIVAVPFADAEEATVWAVAHRVPAHLHPPLVSKEDAASEIWGKEGG